MALLTPNFALSELTATVQVGDDGKRIYNQPGDVELLYLLVLCERLLEPIRALWDCPVQVTSGYRSREVELAVSHKDWGQHRKGQAADIVPGTHDLSIYEAYRRIAVSTLPYDQLLLEGQPGHEWIHVSTAPVMYPPRRDALISPDGRTWSVYSPPKQEGPA